MNVSSVKNLNGETFSAVQDATLTDVVQTNSAQWNEISAYELASANYLTAHQSLEDYATTAVVDSISSMLSGAIDYVSSNAGGGGTTGNYVSLDDLSVNIGESNEVADTSSRTFVQGSANSATNAFYALAQGNANYVGSTCLAQGDGNKSYSVSLAQGWWNKADGYSLAQGRSNSAIQNSLSQGYLNSAYYRSYAQGESVSASTNSFGLGYQNYASSDSMAIGDFTNAKSFSLALGSRNDAYIASIALGNGASAKNDSIAIKYNGMDGYASGGSIAIDGNAKDYSLTLGVNNGTVKSEKGSIAIGNANQSYNGVVATNNSIGLGASALNGSLALGCNETYNDGNYASAHSIAVGKGVSATNYGIAIGKYNKVTSAAIVVGDGGNGFPPNRDTFIVFHDGSVSAAGKISANGVELGAGGGGVTGDYVSGVNSVREDDPYVARYTACKVSGDITIESGYWSPEQGYTPSDTYSLINVAQKVNNKLNTTAFSTVSGTFLTSADLEDYYTKSELDTKISTFSSNDEVNTYVQTNSADIDETVSNYQSNSSTYLTNNDLTSYATTAEVDTLSSMLSGAIDYVSSNAGGGESRGIGENGEYIVFNSELTKEQVANLMAQNKFPALKVRPYPHYHLGDKVTDYYIYNPNFGIRDYNYGTKASSYYWGASICDVPYDAYYWSNFSGVMINCTLTISSDNDGVAWASSYCTIQPKSSGYNVYGV